MFVSQVHQTSAQNGVEVNINDGSSGSGTNGRRVKTLTIDENGAQYSRQGKRSNVDATLGADGIQINRNGRNILDGRTADFDVNEDGTRLSLRGRRANLEVNVGVGNNAEYSRQVRRGTTADGSGVKRANVNLDNGTVDMVGRRATAKANENEIGVTKRVRQGTVADGGDTKRAHVDLNTGAVNVVGRRTLITGRIGGTGDEALRIQRVGRDPAERAQRRQARQDRREERRNGNGRSSSPSTQAS